MLLLRLLVVNVLHQNAFLTIGKRKREKAEVEIEIEEVVENTRPIDPCNCALIKIYVKLQSLRNCLDPTYEFQQRPLGVGCETTHIEATPT